jgi:Holliday junction resolvase
VSRGIRRERQVKKMLENEGWLVTRAAGSLGIADLVALKDGERTRLIEVKSDLKNPWDNFRPQRREELKAAAALAGADAWVVWWPPHTEPKWISTDRWPKSTV